MEVQISVFFFLNLREGESDDDGSNSEIIVLDNIKQTK